MLRTLEADRIRSAALTAQILDLEKSLSALRLEHAEVQSRLDSYKYPVLTLPTESVSKIFLHVPSPYPGVPSLIETRSLASLTCVCRKWRDIALSIPSLWRAINLFNQDTPLQQRAHICDLWLKRSRSCSLSIEFNGIGGGVLAISKIIELIAPHRPRLKHLKLFVNNLDVCAFYWQGTMPVLHHLDLDVLCFSSELVSFGGLPLLRSVVLNGVASQSVRLPWAQLTSLVLHKVTLEAFIPILSQTSNLLHCELHLRNPVFDSDGVATVPFLESLVLKAQQDDHPAFEYLKFFITPALSNLTIPERFLGLEPLRSLTDFIPKSGGKLRDVCITGRKLVPKNLYREALQSVPRLSFSQREFSGRAGEDDLELESDYDSSVAANTD
ncbi:F-box domain-containing protein [Mycena sanguinolenta]|uniref:F-box domain-containing protein n=1 Tax=Mycena sanguinolenta TaxID=230812 RepID=A0A8H6Y6Z9_9AGAR|nr:F-box domain-containing protein [Mycena sanguinolenta]